MLTILIMFLVVLAVVAVVILVGYGIFLKLVKANVVWTRVEQGWCKIRLRWGKFAKILDPGLHCIGLPGMHTLHERKMTFLKSVTDKDGKPQAEIRPRDRKDPQFDPLKDGKVISFKTTDYPYAFPFKDEEDSHGLHLSGMMAAIGVVENYEKALFTADDWYAVTNNAIMPPFRDLLSTISYDDDMVGRDRKDEQAKETFSKRLWTKLTSPTDEGDDRRSVVEKLRTEYGIRIKSIELRSVDPPPGYRDKTLAPYLAERDKAAAAIEAEASAARFDDTSQALKKWLEAQPKDKNGNPQVTQAQIEAKQDELRQRALAKTNGYQQIHVKGLENATTAVVGGAGTGIMVGNQGGGQGPRRRNSGGGQGGGKTEEQKFDDLMRKKGE